MDKQREAFELEHGVQTNIEYSEKNDMYFHINGRPSQLADTLNQCYMYFKSGRQAATKQAEESRIKSVTRFKWSENVSGTRANELLDGLASLQSQIESLQADLDKLNEACEQAEAYSFHSECGNMGVVRAMRKFNTPEAIAKGKLIGAAWSAGK